MIDDSDFKLMLAEVVNMFKPKFHRGLYEMKENDIKTLWYILHSIIQTKKME